MLINSHGQLKKADIRIWC